MTVSTKHLTPEQIEAALPMLTADEVNKVSRALAKEAGRRLRNKDN